MYTFLLWTQAGREAIAREEIEPHRRALLAKYPNDSLAQMIVVRHMDEAERVTAYNIHPLCLLGLRRKITSSIN